MSVFMPILIGLIAICGMSLIREPHRRRINALTVAGAGAAYLSGGGFGPWEFVLPVVMTYVAYKGLDNWTFIGIGWLLHTAWDIGHHLQGSPIIPFAEYSSFGCAICDPVLALWCFAGGPSITDWACTRWKGVRARSRSAVRGEARPGPPDGSAVALRWESARWRAWWRPDAPWLGGVLWSSARRSPESSRGHWWTGRRRYG
ncbi:DUF6010 family protein [Nonomuraea sp. NPDC049269]|uniref:DUF6010 family protein n=1 Tax=Nonomuraea sp. NPDC049269 TaxID=3364349 RepID=UPI00371F2B34